MNSTACQFVVKEPVAADSLREAVDAAWLVAEAAHLEPLKDAARLDPAAARRVLERAAGLVRRVRKRADDSGAMEAFMREYDLSSEEGVVLMCLAEALLRIPDAETAEKLISDKLAEANWETHLGKSESLFVNASTWGLMLTGRLVRVSESARKDFTSVLARLANKSGEPLVRIAIGQAMRIMGHQYVMGRTIRAALERSRKKASRRFRHSFDMLGEAALTAADAERYRKAYAGAIEAIGNSHDGRDIFAAPSISVKLSALHPRFEHAKRERVLAELTPVLLDLAQRARGAGIALTVDTEEAERLMLTVDVFAAVLEHESLDGWDGLGLALQAYQKRAWPLIDWLAAEAERSGHRIPVRLVKGAYWDTEIKFAQVEGLGGYPVFTRKANTDVSYIACARKILDQPAAFYPQFATHNAHTISVIAELAGARTDFEYQRLHGMGRELYDEVLDNETFNGHCRVYAPVGNHKDLLPYLVRRLLENGANTSFVNRIVDKKLPVEEVVSDPLAQVDGFERAAHPNIPLPRELYGDERRNSAGINFASEAELKALKEAMEQHGCGRWPAGPLGAGRYPAAEPVPVVAPANRDDTVCALTEARPEAAGEAVRIGIQAQPDWDRVDPAERAGLLDRVADLLEENRAEFMALCAREAGKSLKDGIAEVREAADFCRYYAQMAREHFERPRIFRGPTGEHNQMSLHGRGVFVCISPWNFPLAIFTGQVAAALVAGNAVIAKPADQTPLIAHRAVELMHAAGIPDNVLQFLPGGGELGAALTREAGISGVAFTGSTETARIINRVLAEKEGPLATLIAETGGQNAMIVDSSALPEQVVKDVIHSAFLSAGQRCSALRILCVQRDVSDHVLEMLAGAMEELAIGDPGLMANDIGPVIDAAQLEMLQDHGRRMDREAREIARVPLPTDLPDGFWFAPRAYEIDAIERLEGEVFGPVLHVVRYRARDLDRVIESLNNTGYGLTLGIHSRIDRTQDYIASRVRVGNAYINRNMTGAIVGVQPFGGEGLSGTGPKAGGPHYLIRFATERTRTVNTAAVGGNASLMALSD